MSLTTPVRTESYVWADQLPPVLQMSLTEGYLLQVLQEQFGPHIGASPIWACAPSPNTTPPGSAEPALCATMYPATGG